jgi:23S rRNA G2069 N7-methylase RlmK/C1962 C5-methylase RlmI
MTSFGTNQADKEAMEETDFDLKNPHDLVELIERNLENTDFRTPFISVLQKLLLVSNDEFVGTVMWSSIEEEVHKIVTNDNQTHIDDSFLLSRLEKATELANVLTNKVSLHSRITLISQICIPLS